MSNQVLVLPKGSGLTKAEKAQLAEADIIVVEIKSPHEARMLTAERLPIDSNELLRATMTAVAESNGNYSEGLRLSIMNHIAKAIIASNEAQP